MLLDTVSLDPHPGGNLEGTGTATLVQLGRTTESTGNNDGLSCRPMPMVPFAT